MLRISCQIKSIRISFEEVLLQLPKPDFWLTESPCSQLMRDRRAMGDRGPAVAPRPGFHPPLLSWALASCAWHLVLVHAHTLIINQSFDSFIPICLMVKSQNPPKKIMNVPCLIVNHQPTWVWSPLMWTYPQYTTTISRHTAIFVH